MTEKIIIADIPENTNQTLACGIGIQHQKLQRSNNKIFRKGIGKRSAQKNTINVLLVSSILLACLKVVAAYINIREIDLTIYKLGAFHEQSLFSRSSFGFDPIQFFSFAWFAVTSSFALITIEKMNKTNVRLLLKLRSTKRQSEDKVRKRTSELTEIIRAKDHFLGITTHDLKAPLSSILGLLELIRMENSDRSVTEAEYLAHIEYSCRKMERLIYDLLEINHLEHKKAFVARQQVNVMPLLSKIRLGFAHQAARKNIELVFKEIDATIVTDADSLTRILENLLSNAIKFSPPSKKVVLSVSTDPDHLIFKIMDEGPGIPVDEQPKLFTKFQRLSNRPTNSESSSGLGLSIVKELTLQLGGIITFETAKGKGSTFIVSLPHEQQSHNRLPEGQESKFHSKFYLRGWLLSRSKNNVGSLPKHVWVENIKWIIHICLVTNYLKPIYFTRNYAFLLSILFHISSFFSNAITAVIKAGYIIYMHSVDVFNMGDFTKKRRIQISRFFIQTQSSQTFSRHLI